MKLIIQIPCYNEEATLHIALGALPKQIPGVDTIETLVIDDGSTDGTVDVARRCGVNHIVRQQRNKGLALGFMRGINACIEYGADIIVNTDADNQYCADDIPKLIEPILKGEAEIVIGSRPIDTIQHFSPIKKFLQHMGSWVVARASKTHVEDAPSGFRAISRSAAQKLNCFNKYTYTLETIIQAGQKDITIAWVPVRVNGDLRKSRLVKSIPSYVKRSFEVITRIFMIYRPFRFFVFLGSVPFIAGFLIGLRFVFFYLTGSGGGHVQSLILASLLLGAGFLLFIIALVTDLLSVNRQIMEKIDWRIRLLEDKLEFQVRR